MLGSQCWVLGSGFRDRVLSARFSVSTSTAQALITISCVHHLEDIPLPSEYSTEALVSLYIAFSSNC